MPSNSLRREATCVLRQWLKRRKTSERERRVGIKQMIMSIIKGSDLDNKSIKKIKNEFEMMTAKRCLTPRVRIRRPLEWWDDETTDGLRDWQEQVY
jgi:hypothetical protein